MQRQLLAEHRGQVDLPPLPRVGLRLLDGQSALGEVERPPAERRRLADAEAGERHGRDHRPAGASAASSSELTSSSSSQVRFGCAAFCRRFFPRAGFASRCPYSTASSSTCASTLSTLFDRPMREATLNALHSAPASLVELVPLSHLHGLEVVDELHGDLRQGPPAEVVAQVAVQCPFPMLDGARVNLMLAPLEPGAGEVPEDRLLARLCDGVPAPASARGRGGRRRGRRRAPARHGRGQPQACPARDARAQADPAPPPPCARASRRHSRSSGSGSAAA